ncbi:hypothetical protein AB205_0001070 [Aquarana catesbeiana]|uniref:Uncharacterized protein n=1 Tax=Aquarana catesbeiana TaxID=8400 RepID=A0A2G9Q1Q7_AQUCT|nr:hypothetical protein AB205_0001070 [Aquarana catesbeiana]
MLHLGTLATKKIVPHFQTKFHIYSSAIKYLCAKYTIFLYIGEKRLGGHPSSEETRDPPTSGRRGNPPKTNRAGGGRRGGNWHHNR